MLITVRAREDNEDLSVSNSSPLEPSATLKALSGNRPSSRVSSYAEGILRMYVRTPEGSSCCYRLPSESPRRKRTLKPGKGLMSPSAEAHCDAREDRARVAPRDASPLPGCSRGPLRTRLVRGCVLGSGKVILMTPSLVARRDTCMVVLARQEVRLDKHARLDSQKYAIHMHDVGALVRVARILTSRKKRRLFFSVACYFL